MKTIRSGAAGAIYFFGCVIFALAWALSELIDVSHDDLV